jgi:hypothetical protein
MSIVIVQTTSEDWEPYFKCAICGRHFLASDMELGFHPHVPGVEERVGTDICQTCRKGGAVSRLAPRGRLAFWAMPDVLRRVSRLDRSSLLARIQAQRR